MCSLQTFGDTEAHHGLGGNLDGFTGLRVPAFACLPVRLAKLAEARKGKYVLIPGLLGGDVQQLVKEHQRSLLRNLDMLSKIPQ